MKLTRDNLQQTLRETEKQTDLYSLAKQFNTNVDSILLFIQDSILPEYQQQFNTNAHRIPFWTEEQSQQFFQQQIIDLGFLCQHKIKEIADQLKQRHSIFAHQLFYNNWLLQRGY